MRPWTDAEAASLHSILTAHLGLCIDRHNREQVDEAIRQRLAVAGCTSLADYLKLFENSSFSARELREFTVRLTVPETYFFRHPEHFQAVAELALPERFKLRGKDRGINILSAGSASGEEPYSLAAIVWQLAPAPDCERTRIWGIDINPSLLKKASQARYSPWSLRGMEELERLRFFTRSGKDYVLHGKIRTMVSFQERNLMHQDPDFWQPDFFDIIFCRNVLMYFVPHVVQEVIERLSRCITPGGYLFLAPSESLRGKTHAFHLRHTHGAFYYQRPYAEELTAAPYCVRTGPESSEPDSLAGHDETWVASIANANRRIAALQSQSKISGMEVLQDANEVPPLGSAEITPAWELLREERFAEALTALNALPLSDDPDRLLLQATLLTNVGKVEEAQQICARILMLDELNAGAHYLTALCLEHCGDYLAAAEHDQKAAYLDGEFAMPRLHLALLAKRLGDLKTAERELTAALALFAKEGSSRIVLFGGGFDRQGLIRICRSHLQSCGGVA